MLKNDVALPYTLTDVRHAFAPQTLARGEVYASEGRVMQLGVTNGGATISARVSGSRPQAYLVTIYITRSRSGRTIIAGSCDCSVAVDCKHVAAALVAALELGATPRRPPAAAGGRQGRATASGRTSRPACRALVARPSGCRTRFDRKHDRIDRVRLR